MIKEDDFYYRFEQRFRGAREEIIRRQSAYLPIIEPLKKFYPQPHALDLGCGRGEWLELLSNNGFFAQGVDVDDAMLAFCTNQGLDVHKADAVEYLKSVPDVTLALVSGFHIAEHLPFEVLRELFSEAFRVLAPGGILILETPNPENLTVAANDFYTDPTHRAPLPPDLLSFLCEDAGFARVKILRLNQRPADSFSSEVTVPSISRVISGVSPDYSIVAQTVSDRSISDAFEWFSSPEDLSHSLGAKLADFDSNLQAVVEQVNSNHRREQGTLEILAEREREVGRTQAQLQHSREETQRFSQALAQRERDFGSQLVQERERVQRLENELRSVYASWSWKLTAPLRKGNALAHSAFSAIAGIPSKATNSAKGMARPLVIRAMRFVLTRPVLKSRALVWVRRHPSLEARLRLFAVARGILPGMPASAATAPQVATQVSALPESARIIYDRLCAVMQDPHRGA